MKKVLILTAGFGEGHNAAARNLRDALELISPDTQVEVLDLFESTYGRLNTLVKQAHLGVVRYAPTLWRGIFSLLDHVSVADSGLTGLTRLRTALGDVLRVTQPDCVVSTYPAYAPVIKELFRDHSEKPFRLVTVVTDSISVNAAWHRAPSDAFVVANQPTATVLHAAGVPGERIHALASPSARSLPRPASCRSRWRTTAPSSCFTSSTTGRRSAAKSSTACWRTSASTSPSPRAATRS